MQNLASLRWAAWFGDRDLPLKFPSRWEVHTFQPKGGKDLGERGLRAALAQPIESPTLRELAQGKRDAVIVVDDLTRPTPAHRLLPLVIKELVAGGMEQDNIRIIIGAAAHHPMLREDIIKKVGRDIADTFTVSNHNVFENNEYLGKTSAGTPVYINRDFLRADVKICVGSILPHGGPGFGGGAKLVLPGVAGIETIYQNHRSDNGYARGVNRLEGNVMRSDMEEAAAMAGLNFIVNSVLNPQREIVGLFCGHFIAAHRRGCELARIVYGTPAPRDYDVAILSAYPKDSECYQSGNAMNVMNSAQQPIVHEKGSVVIASAGSQGMGEHFLGGPGFRLGAQRIAARRASSPDRTRLLFCENVSSRDIERWGGDGDSLCRSWRDVVNRLRDLHGKDARVAVFPCAAMQLGYYADEG